MIVWTVQPESALESIHEHGCFRCDESKSFNLSKPNSLRRPYQWLMAKMREKIGPPPKGVSYPIWAWHTWDFQHRAPDTESSAFLKRSERKILFTLEISDGELVLSDFDAWQNVMLETYVADIRSEEEYDALEEHIDALSPKELDQEIVRSWDNVFLTDKVDNGFMLRGRYVQATFWEIKKEYIKEVKVLEPNT